MKRKVIIGIIVALVIVTLVVINNKPAENSNGKPVVKIGFILPLSGSAGHVGQTFKSLLGILEEDLKDSKYNYEFIFEDSAFDNKKVLLIANKMKNLDKVDIIFTPTTANAKIVNSILGENTDTVHVAWAFDETLLDREQTIVYGVHPKDSVEASAKELQKRELDKVNIFVLNDSLSENILTQIEKQFPKHKINYDIIKFNAKEKRFRSIIHKAMDDDDEINMIISYPPEVDILGQQLKETYPDFPVTSIIAFNYSTKKKELFENEWFIYYKTYIDETYLAKKFKEKTGSSDMIGGESVYEVFKIITNFAESIDLKDGEFNKEELVQKIKNQKDFNSDLGKIYIDNSGYMRMPADVFIIKNGKVEVLKE